MKYGRSSSWCKSHALSFRALSRAVSIRAQLKKYMQRFSLPLESCQGDAKRVRRCLVSGYWRNGARWMADGTFRSVRGNKVSILKRLHPNRGTNDFQRPCTYIPLRCCSPESHALDGSFSMRWKRQRKRKSGSLLKSRPTGKDAQLPTSVHMW